MKLKGLTSRLQQMAATQFQLVLILSFFQAMFAIVEKTPKEMEKLLKEHDIVPDIIEFPPQHELQIKYVYGYIPNFGNDLNPNDLEGPPFLVRFTRERDEYFTLLMVDPDQPSRSGPDEREWVHWLVTNMDGCSVLNGDTIVKYLEPRPGQGTGPHRYIFILFKQEDGPQKFQDEKIINNTKYDPKIRGHWSTKEFIKRNHFYKPHAMTFFYSEWKPPRRHSTTIPPEFDFTYQTIEADILTGDIDYDASTVSGDHAHKNSTSGKN